MQKHDQNTAKNDFETTWGLEGVVANQLQQGEDMLDGGNEREEQSCLSEGPIFGQSIARIGTKKSVKQSHSQITTHTSPWSSPQNHLKLTRHPSILKSPLQQQSTRICLRSLQKTKKYQKNLLERPQNCQKSPKGRKTRTASSAHISPAASIAVSWSCTLSAWTARMRQAR